MTSPTWAEYVRQIASNVSQNSIAAETGISAATLTRWFKDGLTPSPEHAIRFARTYKASPVEALVIAGYLTADEAEMRNATAFDLTAFTSDALVVMLAREIGKRYDMGLDRELLDQPITVPTGLHGVNPVDSPLASEAGSGDATDDDRLNGVLTASTEQPKINRLG